MKLYAVETRYIFKGSFYIRAENKAQAREYAEKQCGLVLGRGIYSTLSDEDVDWDFPVHPDKVVGSIRASRKQEKAYEQTS